MEKKSWLCTVIIQLALCFALYCALNMGESQTPTYPNDIYFISVRGGFRPLKQQTHLLKQIEKMMYAYNVGFVINVSELGGEDDPLLHNATRYFGSLKAPWYTTIALNDDVPNYFFKQYNISSRRTLSIISLNTQKFKISSSGVDDLQLKKLSRTIDSSNSNWHIAAVFHPLFCNQSLEQTQGERNDFLHQMLLKHGVDAYLSGQPCDNEARTGGPYLTGISEGSYPPRKLVNMFLLHRVSPFEITTYGVGFKGDIIHESTVRQRGREAM